jgi:hypothetical protein
VLAVDGSFNFDAIAVVAIELGAVPHLDVVGLWQPWPGEADYRMPIVTVEEAIKAECKAAEGSRGRGRPVPVQGSPTGRRPGD